MPSAGRRRRGLDLEGAGVDPAGHRLAVDVPVRGLDPVDRLGAPVRRRRPRERPRERPGRPIVPGRGVAEGDLHGDGVGVELGEVLPVVQRPTPGLIAQLPREWCEIDVVVEPDSRDIPDVGPGGRPRHDVVERRMARARGEAQAEALVVRQRAVDDHVVAPARDDDPVAVPRADDVLDPPAGHVEEADAVDGAGRMDAADGDALGLLHEQTRPAALDPEVGDLGPRPADDADASLFGPRVDRGLAVARPAEAHAGREPDRAGVRPRGQGDHVAGLGPGDHPVERRAGRCRDRIPRGAAGGDRSQQCGPAHDAGQTGRRRGASGFAGDHRRPRGDVMSWGVSVGHSQVQANWHRSDAATSRIRPR